MIFNALSVKFGASLVAATVSISADAALADAPQDIQTAPRLTMAGRETTVRERLTLELRRAGGPRQDVVDVILNDASELAPEAWLWYVLRSCYAGGAHCRDHVSVARERSGEASQESRQAAETYLAGVEEMACLESLSVSQRVDYFRLSLQLGGRSPGVGGCPPLDAQKAAIKALELGLVQLVPDIEESMASWPFPPSEMLEARLHVAKILASQDPLGGLLELVKSAAQTEVDWLVTIADGSAQAVRTIQAPTAAWVALQELRQQNPSGAAGKLKEIFRLYDRSRAAYQVARERMMREGALPRDLPGNVAHLGEHGVMVAELIGDLGDREFERAALGGRCLWDQVREVELELVKQGKLKRKAMVSVETAARE
jgi:hypothetical protein